MNYFEDDKMFKIRHVQQQFDSMRLIWIFGLMAILLMRFGAQMAAHYIL